jgi:hypothetical protein
LAKNIEIAKDIKELEKYNSQISPELNGHKNLEFLVLKRRYELKEEILKKRLTNLQNPRIWEKVGNFRKSQEEKDREIEVLKKLFNIAKEEREGLKEGETIKERETREKGIRDRAIRETAYIISLAIDEKLEAEKAAVKVAIKRVALARLIYEQAITTTMKLKEKKAKNLIEAEKAEENAGQELKKREDDLGSLGLNLTTEEGKITEKKEFYKDNENFGNELKTKDDEFVLKFKDLKTAKERVDIIEIVNLQTERMKEIYIEAREEIKRREEACTYIDGLKLGDEKEKYKTDVLNYDLDLTEVLKTVKSSARAKQKEILKTRLTSSQFDYVFQLDEKFLSTAIQDLLADGANVDEVIKTIKEKYVDETREFLKQFKTLSEEEKTAFAGELLADGSNVYDIRTRAILKGRENNNRVREFKSSIDKIYLSKKRKKELKTIVNAAGTNIEEIKGSIVQDQRDSLGKDIKDMLLTDEQKEELKKKINTEALLKTEDDYQEILNGTKSLRKENAIKLINTLDGISSTIKGNIQDSIKQGKISPEEGLNSAKKTADAMNRISKLPNLNDEDKENLYKEINLDLSNIDKVMKEAEAMNSENSSRQTPDGDGPSGGDETPDGDGPSAEDEKVKTEVIKEGKKGYIIIESSQLLRAYAR